MDPISSSVIDSLQNTAISNVTLNLIINMLSSVKYGPVTTTAFKDEYDYIIVGAGSAGSTLAARLSEAENVDVLLLEAGPDPPLVSEVPILQGSLLATDIDWNYRSTPQEHMGSGLINRVMWRTRHLKIFEVPSGGDILCSDGLYRLLDSEPKTMFVRGGKTIGGTSTINGMLYVRGNRKNYDEWARGGATGWSYDEVLPYFKKLEDNRNPEFVNNFGGRGYHGFSGPMTAIMPPFRSKLWKATLAAAEELDYPILDVNGEQQKGFYPIQATIRDGRRCGTAKAYLADVDYRENLDIVKNAFVTKVLFEGKRAVGVELFYPGNSTEKHTVRTRREVIVSAGTLNTPKLLMLSGIGPREELEKHKIPVVEDLPVGSNLQDHLHVLVPYQLSDAHLTINEKAVLGAPEYSENATGPVASIAGMTVVAFLSKRANATPDDLPDYQLYFIEQKADLIRTASNVKDEIYNEVFAPHEQESTMFCYSELINPRSRGTVTLRSKDPLDPPVVNPNYLADPGDLEDILQGMKKCEEIVDTESMRHLGVKRWQEKLPGCQQYELYSDEYYTCYIKSISASIWHFVGAAKMGSVDDPTTVVDPKLRVKGIKGLRVVDGSVIPRIPSGNPNVPIIMIAEKAADLIKETIQNEDD